MKRESATISETLITMYTLAELHDDALYNDEMQTAEGILHTLKTGADVMMEQTTPDYLDANEQKFIVDIVNANFNHYSGENNEVQ